MFPIRLTYNGVLGDIFEEDKPLKIKLKGGAGSGNFNHSGRPGEVGGSSPFSGNYLPPEQRVWQGKQLPSSNLSKLDTGSIGEKIAMRALQDKLGAEFSSINTIGNNAPIDVAGDHHAIEVKAGLASNGRSAQQWRATIGQPGKEETARLKGMSPNEKRQYNQYKQEQIIAHKEKMLSKMSEIAGTVIKPAVIGVITDGKRADVFMIPGFHLRLSWKEHATEANYLGTYEL